MKLPSVQQFVLQHVQQVLSIVYVLNALLNSAAMDVLNALLNSSAMDVLNATLNSAAMDVLNALLNSAVMDVLNALLNSAAMDVHLYTYMHGRLRSKRLTFLKAGGQFFGKFSAGIHEALQNTIQRLAC